MTLQTKLSIVFAVFAAVLVVVLGLFVRSLGSHAIGLSTDGRLTQAAQQMSGRLDRLMGFRLNEISMAASTEEVFVAGDRDARRRYMVRLQQSYPNYAWIGFADAAGRVDSATGGHLEGVDVSERPWFAAGLLEPVALDVHEAKLLQRILAPSGTEPLRFVDVASPVRDGTGKVVGVLAGHLSWSWADDVRRDVLSTMEGLEGTDILVLAADGKVLLGPSDVAGKPYAADPENWVEAVSATDGDHGFRGLGWSVVVRQPLEEALAPIYELDYAIVFVGMVVLALAMAAGRYLAQYVTRPLSAIARAAEKARTGGLVEISALRGSCVEIESLSVVLASTFSNLRSIQTELEETNASLEERVLLRTRQAEEAARVKGEFLATMSHEIRTPLNAILGFADIVLDEKDLSPEVERRVLLIKNAGASLKKVVDDVLDMSKAEEGKIELDLRPFSPTRLLEEVVCLMETQAEKNAVSLSCEIDPSVGPAAIGEESHLRQVLVNLASNAIKFSEGGTVVLRAVRPYADAHAVLFTVVDDGIGMTEEQVGRLFSRYSQADGTIHSRFGGTGLGLAISQQLVTAMGGTIRVESEQGTGSTFSFAVDLPSTDGLLVQSPVDVVEGTGGILLVEDVETNREVATIMLERAGYKVVAVSSGEEAVAVVSWRPFDLVLMDIQMPGMDGRQTAATMRRMLGLETMPIVAFTANTLPSEIATFSASGIDDFVGKPVDRATLLAKVAEWMPSEDLRARQPVSAPVAQDSFDEEVFAELLDLLGPVRAGKAACELVSLVDDMDPLVHGNREAGRRAHRAVTVAGTLGFVELSVRCRDLDGACRDETADVSCQHAAATAAYGTIRARLAQIAALVAVPETRAA